MVEHWNKETRKQLKFGGDLIGSINWQTKRITQENQKYMFTL